MFIFTSLTQTLYLNMKNLTNILLLSLTVFYLISCSREDVYDDQSTSLVTSNTLKFTFEGIEYNSEYSYADDSSLIFKDCISAKIYNSLIEYPQLSALVIDNDLYYFKTREEMEVFMSTPTNLKTASLYNTLIGVKYTFYEDYKYKGDRYTYQIGNYDISTKAVKNNSVISMSFPNKGNALTSLDIYVRTNNTNTTTPYIVGTTLHDGFSNYTFTFLFTAPVTSKGIRGLGDYKHPYSTIYGKNITWNDIAESAEIFIKDVPGF